ncbi:MAG: Hpt domain-containing protein [Bacteroidales bacterium]|nr:Hpt domain-containing protein [Bacteroidales bacterium]
MTENRLYDFTFLNKISGGDQSFILEMINTFKETAPDYLKKARLYLDNEAIDALSKETHRFIPGVSFLGAKLLEEDLLKIEDYTKKGENLDKVPELIENVDHKIHSLIDIFNKEFSTS